MCVLKQQRGQTRSGTAQTFIGLGPFGNSLQSLTIRKQVTPLANHPATAQPAWMAKLPTPPAPPCTSTRLPASGMAGASACHAVRPDTGTEAASWKDTPAGMRARTDSSAATNSALVPAAEPRSGGFWWCLCLHRQQRASWGCITSCRCGMTKRNRCSRHSGQGLQ